jgi:hypothetical protein
VQRLQQASLDYAPELRWEIFAESLQDYALLQASGLALDDPAQPAFKS